MTGYEIYLNAGGMNDQERNGAVIFYDGKLLISEPDVSHAELLGYGWKRREIPRKVSENVYLTFGHLYADTIILEDWQYRSVGDRDTEKPHSFKQLVSILSKKRKKYKVLVVNRDGNIIKEVF